MSYSISNGLLYNTIKNDDVFEEYIEFAKVPITSVDTESDFAVYAITYELDIDTHNKLVEKVKEYIHDNCNNIYEYCGSHRIDDPLSFMNNITLILYKFK